MAADDLRALLDPWAALLAARPKQRIVPAQTYTPAPLPNLPDPEPVTIPERTELYVDPASLPEELTAAGSVSINALVATLHSAVAWMWDKQEIRAVTGRITLTSGLYQPGVYDFPVTWDAAPLKVPAGGIVATNAGVAWQGRTHAKIKTGSITSAGCTVTMTVVSATVPTSGQPLTMEAQALYLYLPPYQP
jgi:hypothetical protein